MKINDLNAVESVAKKALSFKDRYNTVASQTGVPWGVIACIHYREANFNFFTHLHNGDPLSARTVHVPKGRPVSGTPPFKWEFSAIDALRYDGLDKVTDWSLNSTLYQLEKYNGFGYREYHNMNSPYLWAGTNWYTQGKYGYDNQFNPSLIDKQIGCAPLLATLTEMDEKWI